MFYDEFFSLCNKIQKTPTAVAKEIGLSGAHVTKWKKGSTPTDTTKAKICKYFDLPISYFSDKEKEKTTSQTRNGLSSDPDIRRIERAKSSMPSDLWERQMKIIEASFGEYFSDDFYHEDSDE